MRRAEILEAVHVQGKEGEGTENDPARSVDYYWSKKGTLLATRDAWKESETCSDSSDDR
jgi:hypothetical protein